jgi:hypothetical protein
MQVEGDRVLAMLDPSSPVLRRAEVIGTLLYIGIMAMLLGVALMLWSWYANPAFFRNPHSATPVKAPGTGETRGERQW